VKDQWREIFERGLKTPGSIVVMHTTGTLLGPQASTAKQSLFFEDLSEYLPGSNVIALNVGEFLDVEAAAMKKLLDAVKESNIAHLYFQEGDRFKTEKVDIRNHMKHVNAWKPGYLKQLARDEVYALGGVNAWHNFTTQLKTRADWYVRYPKEYLQYHVNTKGPEDLRNPEKREFYPYIRKRVAILSEELAKLLREEQANLPPAAAEEPQADDESSEDEEEDDEEEVEKGEVVEGGEAEEEEEGIATEDANIFVDRDAHDDGPPATAMDTGEEDDRPVVISEDLMAAYRELLSKLKALINAFGVAPGDVLVGVPIGALEDAIDEGSRAIGVNDEAVREALSNMQAVYDARSAELQQINAEAAAKAQAAAAAEAAPAEAPPLPPPLVPPVPDGTNPDYGLLYDIWLKKSKGKGFSADIWRTVLQREKAQGRFNEQDIEVLLQLARDNRMVPRDKAPPAPPPRKNANSRPGFQSSKRQKTTRARPRSAGFGPHFQTSMRDRLVAAMGGLRL